MKNNFTKQKVIPFVGEFRQLFGGATTWISMVTFLFAGIAAWNTNTMSEIRKIFPWLDMWSFCAIIFLGIIIVMFLEHKYVQISILNYWNKMQYETSPMKKAHEEEMKKMQELGDKIDKFIEQNNKKS